MITPRGQENARAHDFVISVLARKPDLWHLPMIAVCPAGHSSLAQDYCDVCGLPIDCRDRRQRQVASPASTASPARAPSHVPTAEPTTPSTRCSAKTAATTSPRERCPGRSSRPRPQTTHVSRAHSPPAPTPASPADAMTPRLPRRFDWVAEVWIDPAWYEAQQSPDPMPSPGLPVVVPLREKSILVGRTSHSRNIHPQIDCEPDSGVSRRQTQLDHRRHPLVGRGLGLRQRHVRCRGHGPDPEQPDSSRGEARTGR